MAFGSSSSCQTNLVSFFKKKMQMKKCNGVVIFCRGPDNSAKWKITN